MYYGVNDWVIVGNIIYCLVLLVNYNIFFK